MIKSQSSRRLRRSRRGGARAAAALAAALALVGLDATGRAQSGFPFGRELLLDVAPMKGSKRVPILDIKDDGLAELTLWCATAPARLIVVADTITVLIGPKAQQSCTPEQASADETTAAALAQATNWRFDGDALTLTGGPTPVRFRAQTN